LLALPFAMALAACSFIPSRASEALVREILPGDLDSLKHLREHAERAPAAGRDSAWFRVATFAVELATSGGEREPVASAERELERACKQLAPASLVAVSARGQHPLVSAAYARAIEKAGSAASTKNPRPSGSQEAGAEVREALARFGAARAGGLLELAKKCPEAAFGAGAASQSVYRIALLAPELEDSTASGFALGSGFRSGIRSVAGAWSDRFVVSNASFANADVDTRRVVHRALDLGSGILVVGGGDDVLSVAAAAGRERRVVVLDARGAEAVTIEPHWIDREVWNSDPFHVGFSSNLKLQRMSGSDTDTETTTAFVVRPSSCDQARALAQIVLSRTNLTKVAIAMPSSGGDYGLARCFSSAMRGIGRESVDIMYEPGRRDFSREVQRFREAKAQAILLAGPAEESEEWLAALRKARLTPVVLGTRDLDPNGMHEATRAAAEGAIYVGDEWEFVRADEERRAVAAAERDSFVGSDDYRRGFRLGQNLARTIMDGAFTPSRLFRELRSISRSEGTQTPPRLAGDDARDRLPVYVIRNGKPERMAAGVRQTPSR
jgi:ABC-type branched-subunit amino acid transport system substrate-binding protein